MDRRDLLAAAGGIGALLLVGAFLAVLPALDGLPAAEAQVLRYTLAAVVLLTLCRRRGLPLLPARADAGRVLAVAATGMAGFSLLADGAVAHGSPASAGVVIGCSPIVFALLVPLSAGRRPRPGLVCAAVAVAVGAGIVQGLGTRPDAVGVLFSLGALGGEVAFSLLAAPLVRRHGALATSTWTCVAAVPLLVLPTALDPAARLPTGPELLGIVYLATGATVVAFVLWYRAVDRLGVERAGLLSGAMPVGALLGGVLLRTGGAGLAELAGTALVVAGIVAGLRLGAASAPEGAGAEAPGLRDLPAAGVAAADADRHRAGLATA